MVAPRDAATTAIAANQRIGSGDRGTPRPMRRRSNRRPNPSTPPCTSSVPARTARITGSARAMPRLRRTTDTVASRRLPSRPGGRRDSGQRATTSRPSPAIATPATTIAVESVVAKASTPQPTIPAGAPSRSKRPCAVSTRSMRSVRSSSSVIQATSAPLEIAQPRPHRHCDTTSSGKPPTTPVMAIPAPITTWPATKVSLRLTASATAPAGTSATNTVSPWNTPIRISSTGDRSATTTRYSAAVSHQPRASAARRKVHRR